MCCESLLIRDVVRSYWSVCVCVCVRAFFSPAVGSADEHGTGLASKAAIMFDR